MAVSLSVCGWALHLAQPAAPSASIPFRIPPWCVGLNGASAYDLQSSSANESNTLNLNGGTLALGEFSMSGLGSNGFGTGSPSYPQANVIFNGGTVVAGLANSDLTMGATTPLNMKFTDSTGGLTLDLNGKSGVAWGKPITSSSSGTTFTDGGLKYVSNSAPGTITLTTVQLYAGPTTIGKGATVIVSNSNLLGNPVAGGAVNFAGGTMVMTQSMALATSDGGSGSTLTHRYSFNDDHTSSIFDSATNTDFAGSLNPNPFNSTASSAATISGGALHLTGLPNSGSSVNLNLFDSQNYSNGAMSFVVFYTPKTQASNAMLFTMGNTSTGSGYDYLFAQAASGSATGNLRAAVTAIGTTGEISAQTAQPATGSQQMAVVTIDGSNLSLYVDGVLKQTTPLTTANGGTFLSNVALFGGINLGGSLFSADPSFNGDISEFRVYDTALSPNYIAATYSAGADIVASPVATNRNITVSNSTVSGSNGAVDLAGFELDIGGNMSGAGTLTLFDGGSVVLTGNSAAGLNIASNVQLFVGTGGSLGALTGGNVANAGKIFINRTDAAGVWGANISDGLTAGTITIVGSGTTTITGNNTYTGPLLVNAGKLLVGANGTTGTLGSGSVTLAGVLGFNRSDNGLSVAATITGGGTVTQVGSGITSVSGNNSYTGGTIFANGELEVDSLNAIGTTGLLSFTGGALRYSATNTSNYQSRFSTAPGQLYAFDTNGQTITFTSPLTSTGNKLP